MARAEKLSNLRQRCIRANEGSLWKDHGDVLMRVIRQGVAIPSKIGSPDILVTWKWVYNKQAEIDRDKDAVEVFEEITKQVEALWDRRAHGIDSQSDRSVDLLVDHL